MILSAILAFIFLTFLSISIIVNLKLSHREKKRSHETDTNTYIIIREYTTGLRGLHLVGTRIH